MSYVEICIKIIVLKIYNKIFSEKKKKKKSWQYNKMSSV